MVLREIQGPPVSNMKTDSHASEANQTPHPARTAFLQSQEKRKNEHRVLGVIGVLK